uniref:Condensin complex subunit 2 n=1 Tax=Rhabditophanes sp. KR3021 TaxID=114890 RepID=A0AC35TRC9_9BILA
MSGFKSIDDIKTSEDFFKAQETVRKSYSPREQIDLLKESVKKADDLYLKDVSLADCDLEGFQIKDCFTDTTEIVKLQCGDDFGLPHLMSFLLEKLRHFINKNTTDAILTIDNLNLWINEYKRANKDATDAKKIPKRDCQYFGMIERVLAELINIKAKVKKDKYSELGKVLKPMTFENNVEEVEISMHVPSNHFMPSNNIDLIDCFVEGQFNTSDIEIIDEEPINRSELIRLSNARNNSKKADKPINSLISHNNIAANRHNEPQIQVMYAGQFDDSEIEIIED